MTADVDPTGETRANARIIAIRSRQSMQKRFFSAGLILLFPFLLFSSAVLGTDLQVKKLDSAPPGEVSESIRGALEATGHQVTAGDQAHSEFWLVRELPLDPTLAPGLGVTFPQIPRSALIGVVRLNQPWTDYKVQRIPAGLYTMRWEIRPDDGNHMGVSYYRDFVKLVPVASDTDVDARYPYDNLMDLSNQASGTHHPASMAAFPVWEEVDEPRVMNNELNQSMFVAKIGDSVLGFVIEGHGEH
jgi:hypothetical protein